MPLDITKPDVIKFLVESYEKTAHLRMRWNELNKSKLEKTATFKGTTKLYTEIDVAKSAIEAGMAATSRDNTVAARHRKTVPIPDATHIPGIADMWKGHSITEVGLGDPKDDPRLIREDIMAPDPIMRPVPPKQSQIIHKGLPYFGRLEYLKVRQKIKPENKYYFQECEGWAYGWRLRDSYFGKNAPSYGRVCRLTRDATSRSGPHPDPAHYTYPKNGAMPCTE